MVIVRFSPYYLVIIVRLLMEYLRTLYRYTLHIPHKVLSIYDPLQDQLLSHRCNCIGLLMAFGYYNYLKTAAVPQLKKRIETYKATHGVKLENYLFILIPGSGTFWNFKNLKIATNLYPKKYDCAGTRDQTFHQAVYKSTDKKYGRERPYFLLDSPMCLLTLNRLQYYTDCTGTLTKKEKKRILEEFLWFLSWLLHEDSMCRPFCRILKYDDLRNGFRLTADLIMELEKNVTLMAEPPLDLSKWTCTFWNLGFAFALWYYFNYLCRVLKDLPDRLRLWEMKHGLPIYHKMIVCVPYSLCPPSLLNDRFDDQLDPDYPLPLTDHIEDVGLIEDYSYQQSVYKLLTDVDTPHFTAVSPNGEHINEIRKELKWDKSVVSEARKELVTELRRLVKEGKPNYSNSCVVLDYDDIQGEKISSHVHNLISS